MKRVITYGTYDLLHQGHINLLRRAKELGDYLIVGVTSDKFDLERGKLNVEDNVIQRVQAVMQTGIADEIIIEEYQGQKIDDIQRYNVDIFAIGSDWEGKFDYLNEYCEVVYLPRTEGISSTQIRESQTSLNIGVVGTGSIASRFVDETEFVSRVKVNYVYNPDIAEAKRFATLKNGLGIASDYEDLLSKSNAIYVASPHLTHYSYVKRALIAGKHVLCETPFVLSKTQAEELYQLAEEQKCILMVALKTAYCPGFGHLITLLKSGVIGEIVDINASVTTLTDSTSSKLNPEEAGGSMNENACFPLLPIFKLFGHDYVDVKFYTKIKGGVDVYTKAIFQYPHAIASFQVGLGVKSEGNMVISGTKGCIYVPSPWWKTEYFELKYENQNDNRRYFYPYEGSGLRYEIKAFLSAIFKNTKYDHKLSKDDNISMAKIQECYINKQTDTIFI